MQVVLGEELSATISALEGYLTLMKWNTILSCYQTTLLLYMASTICTLINLICVSPLYLKLGLGLRAKAFGLLLTTFQERRTIMQMQNHAKTNRTGMDA